MKYNILEVKKISESELLTPVIRACHADVAKLVKLSPDNCPSSPAFITTDRVKDLIRKGVTFYKLVIDNRIVGTVALEKSKDEKDIFYLEKLGIIPEFRHKGLGELLVKFCIDKLRASGALKVSIAIINENEVLKKWYLRLGFKEIRTAKFPQLPFEVSFLDFTL